MTMLMLMMTSHHDGCHDECLLAKKIKPLRLAFFELIGPPMTLEARCIQAPWLFNNIAVPLAGCASARTHRHAQALGVATGAGGGAASQWYSKIAEKTRAHAENAERALRTTASGARRTCGEHAANTRQNTPKMSNAPNAPDMPNVSHRKHAASTGRTHGEHAARAQQVEHAEHVERAERDKNAAPGERRARGVHMVTWRAHGEHTANTRQQR